MFRHLSPYAGDPILGLLERYNHDPRPEKVNLGIGVYYDEQGDVPVLKCVEQATHHHLTQHEACLYLPMEGDARYRKTVETLIFADAVDTTHFSVATVQTLGGSGALKLGADLLIRTFPAAKIWIGRPTWDNHIAIFQGAGLYVREYSHYEDWSSSFNVEPALSTLQGGAAGDIVLLHACCHNPTAMQPSHEQWGQILDMLQQHKMIPFIDMAYQGFGEGLDEDAWLIRECSRRGMEFLVASSFSKNFSLYGERVGALSVHVAASNHGQVLGQLKLCIRRNYSSPPRTGAAFVGQVLIDPMYRMQWVNELNSMRARVNAMRSELVSHLDGHAYVSQQQGLFAYLQLSPQQVGALREQYGVYMLDSGRLCLAGLNDGNVIRVCEAINRVAALSEHPG